MAAGAESQGGRFPYAPLFFGIFLAVFLPRAGEFPLSLLPTLFALAIALGIALFGGKLEASIPKYVFPALAFALPIAVLVPSGIFSQGPPDFADASYHYYNSRAIASHFSSGGGIVGWSPEFHLGFQTFYDLPPLFFLLSGLPPQIFPGISPPLAFRAVSALSFSLCSLAIYLFSRRVFGTGKIFSLIASVFFIASRHHTFENGVFSAYLSLALALFAAASLFKEGKPSGSKGSLFAAALFFGLSLLGHPGVFAGALVLSTPFIYSAAGKIPFRKTVLPLLAFLAIASPYIFEVLEGRQYHSSSISGMGELFPALFMQEAAFSEISKSPHLVALAVSWAIYSAAFHRKKQAGKGPSPLPAAYVGFALVSSLAALAGILQDFGIAYSSVLLTERMVLVLFASLCLMAAKSLEEAVLGSAGPRSSVFKSALIAVPLAMALFYFSYLAVSWHCPACTPFYDAVNSRPLLEEKGVFASWYGGRNPKEGIFSKDAPAGLALLADLLSRNAKNSTSRVFVEEGSPGEMGLWVHPYLFTESGAEFFGGPPIRLGGRVNTNTLHGRFLGKALWDWDEEDLKRALVRMNVGRLAVFSEDAKVFLSRYPGDFELEYSGGNSSFQVFRYSGCPESYVSGKARMLSYSPTGPEYLADAEGDFEISARFSRRFSAFAIGPEGKEMSRLIVEEEPEYGLVTVRVPEGFSGKVRVAYSPPKAIIWLSLLSLFSLAFSAREAVVGK